MNATIWTTAIACAVMGGIYFAFSSFVMTSLAVMPKPQGIAAMQSINRVIVSSWFIVLFFGTTLASLGLAVWGATHWGHTSALPLVAGGLLYVLGMFVVTAAFNVPLNDALDVVDPATAAAAQVWSKYLRDWTRYNHLRTLCSVAASGLFIAGAWMGR